ncbi:MAG: hypothetical protein M1819_002901 [Sarea resinae]|nr:MAG: hypothetical protein M1819_002901 [Sarea resinae]
MSTTTTTAALQGHEPHPNPQNLTATDTPQTDQKKNPTSSPSKQKADYEPHPSSSVPLPAAHEQIVRSICALYSGSASEADMQVYARDAVYDDPFSFCDSRYKIAGQWYGIPKLFASSKTIKTETVASTPQEIVFKLQQEYTPKLLRMSKAVNSLVSLTLDDEGKVKYHKDMWNEKDYDHQGLGFTLKKLNGDKLTAITKPPQTL